MREFELTQELPLPPPLLLRLLYDDAGAFFSRYHAEVSRDAAAAVTPWAPLRAEQDGPPGQPRPLATRAVRFVKRMELPTAVTSLLGACLGSKGGVGRASLRRRRRQRAASRGRPAAAEPAQRRRLRRAELRAGGADEGAPWSARCRVRPDPGWAQGMDRFTTRVVIRLEAAPTGSLLRQRCRVEAAVFGVRGMATRSAALPLPSHARAQA